MPGGCVESPRSRFLMLREFGPRPPCADGEQDGELDMIAPNSNEKGPVQLAWMVNKIRMACRVMISFTVQVSWTGSTTKFLRRC